jgi:hypothetical protein
MNQQTLFDTPAGTWREVDPFSELAKTSNQADFTGEELADSGMKAAWDATPSQNEILMALESLCRSLGSLTADHLEWELKRLGIELRQPNVIGAAFKMAAKKGWIKFSGRMEKSKRKAAHARLIRVWESLLFPPPYGL